jgi:hypothetical protein
MTLDELVEKNAAYHAKVRVCPHDFVGAAYGSGPCCTRCAIHQTVWLQWRTTELETALREVLQLASMPKWLDDSIAKICRVALGART